MRSRKSLQRLSLEHEGALHRQIRRVELQDVALRDDVVVFLLHLPRDAEDIVLVGLVVGIVLVAQERGRDDAGRGGGDEGLDELLRIAAQRFSKRSQLHLGVGEVGLIAHRPLALEAIEQLRRQLTRTCQPLAQHLAVFGKLGDIGHALARRHAAPAGQPDADIGLEADARRLAVTADIDAAVELLAHQPIGRALDLAAHLGLVDRQVVVALDQKLRQFVGARQAAGMGGEDAVFAGLHRFLDFLDWSLSRCG